MAKRAKGAVQVTGAGATSGRAKGAVQIVGAAAGGLSIPQIIAMTRKPNTPLITM